MKIDTTAHKGVTVAHLEADSLVVGNVSAFRTVMTPITDQFDRVVLDLSKVDFMDSTGLGAMLSCLRALKGKGGALKLTGLTSDVAQLFEIVMMDRVFEIYPSPEEAAESFV